MLLGSRIATPPVFLGVAVLDSWDLVLMLLSVDTGFCGVVVV